MEFREPISQLIRDPREFTKDVSFPDARELRIYDTSLRDGEQMCGIAYTPETKYEICKHLSDIGVHIMDVGFPAVSADERRSLQLIMQGKRTGEIRADLDIVVMCRSTTKDIDATLSALAEIDVAPREVFDVVVLGNHKALVVAVICAAETSVQLQHDRPAIEGQLGGVRVRQVDHAGDTAWVAMTEPAAVTSGRKVRDDIELLARVEQSLLEREVVARRHEQLV